jgi:hypothetical protein
MSRRTIFLIIYGAVMLVMTVLVFLDTKGTLLAKFFLVIFLDFGLSLFGLDVVSLGERRSEETSTG